MTISLVSSKPNPSVIKPMQTEEKANILLVDDNSNNLLALEAILDSLGQNLVKAHSGEEALKCLLERDFAAILLDVQMPGMDGFETATLIRYRDRTCHTPIMFITAIGRSEDFIFKGYSLGAVDYLVKPIVPEILFSKVAVFVDLFQKTEQVKRQAAQLEILNKKLEEQLKEISRLNSECQIANKELKAFNASVCHDLRNPLTIIDGFRQLLSTSSDNRLNETDKNYLEHIQRSCQHMGELIDDLMNLSLGSAGEMHWERVDLSEMARTIGAQLHKSEPQRCVEFEIANQLTAQGDFRLLKIVMENLLGNAWKYTRNKPEAKIEFYLTQYEGKPAYCVRDNGSGFDMAYGSKLFAPFQRLHSKYEFEGTGIGLTTVQRIVHRHGGWIWAKGAVDRGATFCFTLSEGVAQY